MSKKSGVVKWFSRLKDYGYINPDDEGGDALEPHSAIDDGGLGKQYKGDRVELDLIDQEKGPQAKNVVSRRD